MGRLGEGPLRATFRAVSGGQYRAFSEGFSAPSGADFGAFPTTEVGIKCTRTGVLWQGFSGDERRNRPGHGRERGPGPS